MLCWNINSFWSQRETVSTSHPPPPFWKVLSQVITKPMEKTILPQHDTSMTSEVLFFSSSYRQAWAKRFLQGLPLFLLNLVPQGHNQCRIRPGETELRTFRSPWRAGAEAAVLVWPGASFVTHPIVLSLMLIHFLFACVFIYNYF